MNELSLFTGAGGGLLGTHLLGWNPIGYVEWNEYCQRVIAARIADGILPVAPIFTDVREFVQSGAAAEYRGVADVVIIRLETKNLRSEDKCGDTF